MFTFYDFPAAHWVHLRTTNPIESTFATVRHRTRQTKGCARPSPWSSNSRRRPKGVGVVSTTINSSHISSTANCNSKRPHRHQPRSPDTLSSAAPVTPWTNDLHPQHLTISPTPNVTGSPSALESREIPPACRTPRCNRRSILNGLSQHTRWIRIMVLQRPPLAMKSATRSPMTMVVAFVLARMQSCMMDASARRKPVTPLTLPN